MTFRFQPDHWAVILGGSSGFGLATAQKLARHGMNVCVVHRDRRGSMEAIERGFEVIRQTGVGFVAHNLDALSAEGRKTVLDSLAVTMSQTASHGRVRVLLHSIAFGNLKLIAADRSPRAALAAEARKLLAERLSVPVDTLANVVDELTRSGDNDALAALNPSTYSQEAFLEEEDFARTVHSMGTSLVAWTQELLTRGLFAEDARVLAMTSEGSSVAWRGYAAVSAAKSALEACARSLALELAPHGIRTNIIQAGVTDTPALRLIPGSIGLKAEARQRNPFSRLTTPADVADFIALMATDEARWVNGSVLQVDGGEHIAG